MSHEARQEQRELARRERRRVAAIHSRARKKAEEEAARSELDELRRLRTVYEAALPSQGVEQLQRDLQIANGANHNLREELEETKRALVTTRQELETARSLSGSIPDGAPSFPDTAPSFGLATHTPVPSAFANVDYFGEIPALATPFRSSGFIGSAEFLPEEDLMCLDQQILEDDMDSAQGAAVPIEDATGVEDLGDPGHSHRMFLLQRSFSHDDLHNLH